MRRLVLTIVTLAAVGLAAATAFAGHGHGRYYGDRGYGTQYRSQRYYHGSASYRTESGHQQEVNRIKAASSRYRYHTHPRSMYNGPPHPYDYWGW
ncbi:MAG: hypothetical protein A2V70_15000 [Planctomycetes bacterium RBG_13_63_9]|nr:MAG: hypothetical protein A2V70_15000 [Planctomycetes bacterium RBG_13_63_9]